MLYLNQTVPETILISRDAPALQQQVQRAKAHWFRAHPNHLGCDDEDSEAITWIGSCTSDLTARPVPANTGQAQFTDQMGEPGLQFISQVNCGFEVDHPAHTTCSFALRYQPGLDDPCTLLTLNDADAENYLFLSHKDGEIELKDQQNTVRLTHPAPAGDMAQLIVVGLTDSAPFLRVGQTEIVQSDTQPSPELGAHAHLFIGVRGTRRGLKKTLGNFTLLDVIYWPKINILAPTHAAQLAALDAYHWGDL